MLDKTEKMAGMHNDDIHVKSKPSTPVDVALLLVK